MYSSCEPSTSFPLLVPQEGSPKGEDEGLNNDEDASSSSEPNSDLEAVPAALVLSRQLKHYRSQVLGIPLNRILFDHSKKLVVPEPKTLKLGATLAMEAKTVESRQNGQDCGGKDIVSVVFCVRRPGCSACRENAQLLSELAATVPNLSVWAIVKETGVDDEGLLDFAANYFPFPVFKDKSCLIYKAMGDRKISYWGLFTGLFKSSSRIRTKNIGTTFAGEGWIQGGVLIFNRKNHLVYALEENFGNELNAGDIKLAIEAARS